jgi:hypothetical protein
VPQSTIGVAMSEPRLKAALWVQSALRLGDREGQPGLVVRKGDPDAGGILIVLRGRAGLIVLAQTRSGSGQSAWIRGTGLEPVDEAAAEGYVGRQLRIDSDLWVVEFVSPDLIPPFPALIL